MIKKIPCAPCTTCRKSHSAKALHTTQVIIKFDMSSLIILSKNKKLRNPSRAPQRAHKACTLLISKLYSSKTASHSAFAAKTSSSSIIQGLGLQAPLSSIACAQRSQFSQAGCRAACAIKKDMRANRSTRRIFHAGQYRPTPPVLVA